MKYKFKVIDKKTKKEGVPLRLTIIGYEVPEKAGQLHASANIYEGDKLSVTQFYPRDFELIVEKLTDAEEKEECEYCGKPECNYDCDESQAGGFD